MAQQGCAVSGDGVPDARNDRFVLEGFTVHEHFDASFVHEHRAGERIDDRHIEAALSRFLHQSARAVEPGAPGQHSEAEVHAPGRHSLLFHPIVHE